MTVEQVPLCSCGRPALPRNPFCAGCDLDLPPYLPPLQDHGPAPSVPSLLRVAGMSDKHARPWVIVCANGADHRDYGVGKVSVAAYEQLAVDACEFMDAKRKNNPWECGPHTVRRSSCP